MKSCSTSRPLTAPLPLPRRAAPGATWFGGSADICRTLAADGKLLTYTPVHAADLTNAAYGDADGYWYGVSVDAVVFAVNSDVLRRMTISAPKDWADLTDPVYQELIWLPTYRSTEIGRLTAYSAAPAAGPRQGTGLSGSAGHQRTVLHRRG